MLILVQVQVSGLQDVRVRVHALASSKVVGSELHKAKLHPTVPEVLSR